MASRDGGVPSPADSRTPLEPRREAIKSQPHPTPDPSNFPRELRAKLRANIYDTIRLEHAALDRLALAEVVTRAVIAVLIDDWATSPPIMVLTDDEASAVLERTGHVREGLVLSLSMDHRMVLGAVLEKLRRGERLLEADQTFIDGFAALVRPRL